MFVATCVLAAILQPSVPPQEQQDVEMAERRFRQSIHVYLGRSGAKTRLPDVLKEQAASLKIADEKLKRLQAEHKDAISNFVREQATIWASKKINPQIFRAQSSSLTKSTLLIEKSRSWQSLLSGVLTDDELTRWNESRARVFQSEEDEFKKLEQQMATAELEERKREQRQAVFLARQLIAQAAVAAPLAQNRERLLSVCRTLAAGEEQRTQTELDQEIMWLTDSYGLNKKQVRKLQLATRGVAKKRIRHLTSRVDDIAGESASDDVVAEAQLEEILDIMKQLLPRDLAAVPGLPQIPNRTVLSPATEEPLWTKAIKATLSADQQTDYINELTSRAEFRRETLVNWLVLTIDQSTRLRANQREQLKEVFSKYEGSLGQFEKTPPESIYDALPDDLGEQVDLILTRKQRESLASSKAGRPDDLFGR